MQDYSLSFSGTDCHRNNHLFMTLRSVDNRMHEPDEPFFELHAHHLSLIIAEFLTIFTKLQNERANRYGEIADENKPTRPAVQWFF